MKSLLNKFLDVLQPQQILIAFFDVHVFTQGVGCTGFNPSNLKIFVKSLLQVFIQITGAKKIQIVSKGLSRNLYENQKSDRLQQAYLKSGPSYAS